MPKIDQIHLILQSQDPEIVINAIQVLKEVANENSLELLLDLRAKTIESKMCKAIDDFFNTLNIPLLNAAMVKIVTSPRYLSAREKLLSACWQSHLLFDDYLLDFVRLVVEGNYRIAVESFCVIENCIPNPDPKQVIESIDFTLQELNKNEEEKKALLKELLNLLKSFL